MYEPPRVYANSNQRLLLISDSLTVVIYALLNTLNWIILYLTHLHESVALLHVESHEEAADGMVRSSSPASCVGGMMHFGNQQLNGRLLVAWDAHIILILYQQGFCCSSLGGLPTYSAPKCSPISMQCSSCSSFLPLQ